MNSYQLEKKNR